MKYYYLILAVAINIMAIADVSAKDHLRKYFNKNEIKQLHQLAYSFDKFIETNYSNPQNDLNESYSSFFKDLSSYKSYERLHEDILSKIIREKMIDSLDQDLINKIWVNADKESENRFSSTRLKYNGVYVLYLKSNDLFVKYTENIEIMGCISPSNIPLFFELQSKLDLNKVNNRLIIAIHYITISKPLLKRKR